MHVCVGKPFWEKANVAHKIELKIGAAAESLEKLLEVGTLKTETCFHENQC